MGPKLEDFEVLSTIGSGSHGTVRKVRRKGDGQVFVWKELNYGAMTEVEKQGLVTEVNLLRQLHHPHIVRFHHHIVDRRSTTLYILMEHCPGGDLRALVDKCRKSGSYLAEEFVWRVLWELCQALKICHTTSTRKPRSTSPTEPQPQTNSQIPGQPNAAAGRGQGQRSGEGQVILHRDIKPANVFLGSRGEVKLGDFGLARTLGSETSFAKSVVGTPFYMSPEVMAGLEYNERSDMWSLGCLVYELCALKPPFHAHTHAHLAVKIRAARYPPIPAQYSDDLRDLIADLLSPQHFCRPSALMLLHHSAMLSRIGVDGGGGGGEVEEEEEGKGRDVVEKKEEEEERKGRDVVEEKKKEEEERKGRDVVERKEEEEEEEEGEGKIQKEEEKEEEEERGRRKPQQEMEEEEEEKEEEEERKKDTEEEEEDKQHSSPPPPLPSSSSCPPPPPLPSSPPLPPSSSSTCACGGTLSHTQWREKLLSLREMEVNVREREIGVRERERELAVREREREIEMRERERELERRERKVGEMEREAREHLVRGQIFLRNARLRHSGKIGKSGKFHRYPNSDSDPDTTLSADLDESPAKVTTARPDPSVLQNPFLEMRGQVPEVTGSRGKKVIFGDLPRDLSFKSNTLDNPKSRKKRGSIFTLVRGGKGESREKNLVCVDAREEKGDSRDISRVINQVSMDVRERKGDSREISRESREKNLVCMDVREEKGDSRDISRDLRDKKQVAREDMGDSRGISREVRVINQVSVYAREEKGDSRDISRDFRDKNEDSVDVREEKGDSRDISREFREKNQVSMDIRERKGDYKGGLQGDRELRENEICHRENFQGVPDIRENYQTLRERMGDFKGGLKGEREPRENFQGVPDIRENYQTLRERMGDFQGVLKGKMEPRENFQGVSDVREIYQPLRERMGDFQGVLKGGMEPRENFQGVSDIRETYQPLRENFQGVNGTSRGSFRALRDIPGGREGVQGGAGGQQGNTAPFHSDPKTAQGKTAKITSGREIPGKSGQTVGRKSPGFMRFVPRVRSRARLTSDPRNDKENRGSASERVKRLPDLKKPLLVKVNAGREREREREREGERMLKCYNVV
ncbi:uncharacterized protein LOC126988346 [Eriocheir sinensis]|uniref:uncharacterized protein LOC126988346 n=1 Tax=Eriocheir sinensis TaxID=95602 RepID=UPI0021CA2C8A|nr:uncharacterized protein LOC126988346 [Eriocheir sinensis]